MTALAQAPAAPAQSQAPRTPYHIEVTSALVVVNVTVRDREGRLVRGLTKNDFRITEDGKPQTIDSFDYEQAAAAPLVEAAAAPPAPSAAALPAPQQRLPAPEMARDRRLIVLFFDLTSMQPGDVASAVAAARQYVARQMAPADLVAVVSLGTSLQVNLDFTADRGLLDRVLAALNAPSGEGFEAGGTGSAEGAPDTGGSFNPDDTEYNIFDTDRELAALESLAEMLGAIHQRKSVVYFSAGLTRTGIENQSVLRAATDALVKNNVAVYPLDIRGLQALPPGGEAQSASLRGVAAFSGAATLNALGGNFSSQETLTTLANDTGGRAFLDTNDFGRVFTRVQQDTEAYYVLGYHSTDRREDGRFRRIKVQCLRPGVKLEYRAGYFAAKDYRHFTREDKARQIQDELDAPLPDTDLPLYLATGYFRLDGRRWFVPVSLAVPGAAIPFRGGKGLGAASLEIAGIVRAPDGEQVGEIRHTLNLKLAPGELRGKNLQYDTGFVLLPGRYRLRMIVRENQTGTIGSFETSLDLPDPFAPAAPGAAAELPMSSLLVGNRIEAVKAGGGENPLVWKGKQVIPDVTRVFAANQHLYIYFEVYDAAGRRRAPAELRSNVEFLRDGLVRYQSAEVVRRGVNDPRRQAAVFELDVPLAKLPPGLYVCQVNVIDETAARFRFPRFALLVRAPAAPGAAPAAANEPAPGAARGARRPRLVTRSAAPAPDPPC
ncbi:MAG TPA: VWA domain-containing protein [Terriglobales bacterium]|nr:VWA domain-containing protein [Terriglobales bacterium]